MYIIYILYYCQSHFFPFLKTVICQLSDCKISIYSIKSDSPILCAFRPYAKVINAWQPASKSDFPKKRQKKPLDAPRFFCYVWRSAYLCAYETKRMLRETFANNPINPKKENLCA